MDAEKKEAIYKTKYFVIEYLSINKNFWEDMAYATQSAYDRIILIRIEQLEKAMYAKPNLFFNFMIEVLIGPFAGFLIGKVVKTFLNSSFKIFTSISPSLKPMVQTEETKYLSSLDQVVAFKTLNKLPKAERDERIAALSPYTDALQMPKNIEGLNEMWKQMKSGGYKVAKDFIKAGKKESSSADYSDLVTLKDTFQNMCLNASRFFQRKLNHFESLWEFQDWEAVKIEDIKQAAEFVNQNMNLKEFNFSDDPVIEKLTKIHSSIDFKNEATDYIEACLWALMYEGELFTYEIFITGGGWHKVPLEAYLDDYIRTNPQYFGGRKGLSTDYDPRMTPKIDSAILDQMLYRFPHLGYQSSTLNISKLIHSKVYNQKFIQAKSSDDFFPKYVVLAQYFRDIYLEMQKDKYKQFFKDIIREVVKAGESLYEKLPSAIKPKPSQPKNYGAFQQQADFLKQQGFELP